MQSKDRHLFDVSLLTSVSDYTLQLRSAWMSGVHPLCFTLFLIFPLVSRLITLIDSNRNKSTNGKGERTVIFLNIRDKYSFFGENMREENLAGSFVQHFSEVLTGTDLQYYRKSMQRGADCHHIKIKWITIIRMGEAYTLAKAQI